jgi:Ca2+/H+ antiporter, TMEM165/GDT1 family
MMDWTSAGPSVLASFMASMVEFVEALTIVLAVGVVRGWRSALLGAAAGGVLLAALVLILGRTLAGISLPFLQLVVGILLLMFGLRWLRKAVLRAAGVLPLHDEAAAFAKEVREMRQRGAVGREVVDKIAFLTTFKTVMLEGIEVVFIVIALGAGGRLLVPAAAGAGLALLLVIALGLLLHRPLSKVPENQLKFGVGVMLTGFGTFWVGEGIGIEWPGADAAILALIAGFLVIALVLVRVCTSMRARGAQATRSDTAAASVRPSALAGVASELFGLFVDDGWLAAGVLTWVTAGWRVAAWGGMAHLASSVIFAIGLFLVLGVSTMRRAHAD